jgi:plasmid stabilization system protein ParE
MKLRFSPAAKADIKEAARWYDDQQIGLGKRFITTVKAVTQRISQGPQRSQSFSRRSTCFDRTFPVFCVL